MLIIFFLKIEYRNLVVSEEIGSDQFGPYLGMVPMVCVDKANGFIITIHYDLIKVFKTTKNINITFSVSNFEEVHAIYKEYMHSINCLISVSHSIYRSKSVNHKCTVLQINQ